MYLTFDENVVVPKFTEAVKRPLIEDQKYVLYYTNQCPFNGNYFPIVEQTAKENDISFKAICIEKKNKHRHIQALAPLTQCFFNGEFLTNEQFSDKKFLKVDTKQIEKIRFVDLKIV